MNPFRGREATTPSIIREIKKLQGGEQAPRNGALALPKDVAVKPFRPKGLLNANLPILRPSITRGSNGPPGGHSDLGRGFPGLQEDSLEGAVSHRVYYKGEGGGFPQGPGRGESCVSVLPVACPNTKGIQNEF